jgi:putative ABC transport system permease protein
LFRTALDVLSQVRRPQFDWLPVDVRIGLVNAVRQRRRSAFALVAIAFSVIALILANGFIQWIFWATREGTITTSLGHIQVVRPGFFPSGTASPYELLLPDEAPERAMLERIQGVKTVAPRLGFSGLVSRGDTSVSFIGEGVDAERERKIRPESIVYEGTDLSASDPHGIIMGRGLAENLGVGPGDKVVLLVNTRSGINGADVVVRGLFTTISKAYDDVALRAPLSMTQQLFRISGAHRWVVGLDDTDQVAAVAGQAREGMDKRLFEIVEWTKLADFYHKVVALLGQQMMVVKVILVGIILLSVCNTLLIGVTARTSEIGTAMAIGTRRGNVLRQFIAESFGLGVVGAVTGALLAIVLALVISAIGIPMPPPPGQSQGYLGRIMLSPGVVLEAIALAVIAAVLAGAYPAWRASQLEIVDALRHAR